MFWMIAELIGNMNDLEYDHRTTTTYSSVLLPEPAVRSRGHQRMCRSKQLWKHTFAMNPQQRPFRFPIREYAAIKEPFCGSFMVTFQNDAVVR
jgi:hypothetical protein